MDQSSSLYTQNNNCTLIKSVLELFHRSGKSSFVESKAHDYANVSNVIEWFIKREKSSYREGWENKCSPRSIFASTRNRGIKRILGNGIGMEREDVKDACETVIEFYPPLSRRWALRYRHRKHQLSMAPTSPMEPRRLLLGDGGEGLYTAIYNNIHLTQSDQILAIRSQLRGCVRLLFLRQTVSAGMILSSRAHFVHKYIYTICNLKTRSRGFNQTQICVMALYCLPSQITPRRIRLRHVLHSALTIWHVIDSLAVGLCSVLLSSVLFSSLLLTLENPGALNKKGVPVLLLVLD